MAHMSAHLWPSGCTVVFEQHYDARGEHIGQVLQQFPDARSYARGVKELSNLVVIRGKDDEHLGIVNFDKVLAILPILTVGPGAA